MKNLVDASSVNFLLKIVCLFDQTIAKFEKYGFFEKSRVKISRMEQKIKIPASTRYLYY